MQIMHLHQKSEQAHKTWCHKRKRLVMRRAVQVGMGGIILPPLVLAELLSNEHKVIVAVLADVM